MGTRVHTLDWQYVLLVSLLVFSVTVIVVSYVSAYDLRELTPSIHFLVFLEAVSTVTTALFIWATVREGRINRQAILDESRRGIEAQKEEYAKERRKERLREQLEFYAPLAGLVRHENYELSFTDYDMDSHLDNSHFDYELHAEPETRRKFREYYREAPISNVERSKFLKEFRTIVLMEFAALRDEYLSLMRANDAPPGKSAIKDITLLKR